MTNHTSSPERSGRLYYNEDYEAYPASGPLAMRAIRASYMRRAALARAAAVVGSIDAALDEHRVHSASTPPPESLGQGRREDVPISEHWPRRKLGGSAIRHADQPDQKAA